jgi:hypothetical protein
MRDITAVQRANQRIPRLVIDYLIAGSVREWRVIGSSEAVKNPFVDLVTGMKPAVIVAANSERTMIFVMVIPGAPYAVGVTGHG